MTSALYARQYWCLKLIIFVIYVSNDSLCGASLPGETSLEITSCTPANVNIDCGTDVIAFEKIELVYFAGVCTGTYNASDCIIDNSELDRQLALRDCSGKTSCTIDLSGSYDFCTSGVQPVSYVHIEYYCIDSSRIKSICSTGTLTSSSTPVYLTNDNYPSKTTGSNNCSCSIEVQSCSSDINLYTLDLDLYNNVSDCQQGIAFNNAANTNLKTLQCENFYTESSLTTDTLNSNFLTSSFYDNAAVESEGYFFIALAATESGATFSVTCQAQAETWCIDCGSLPALTDGSYTLTGDSSYGSTASVSCNQGYDVNATTVSCLEEGNWGSAKCTIKDCGVPNIDNGAIQLVTAGVTTYNARANVTCNTNYTATTDQISCLASGIWETATCRPDVVDDNDDDDGNGEHGSPPDGTSDNDVVVYVVIPIVLVVLGQTVAISLFHFCIYYNRTQEGHTYAWMLYLGHIPVVGAVFVGRAICLTKRFEKDAIPRCEITIKDICLYVFTGVPLLGLLVLICIHPCRTNGRPGCFFQYDDIGRRFLRKSPSKTVNKVDAEQNNSSANDNTTENRGINNEKDAENSEQNPNEINGNVHELSVNKSDTDMVNFESKTTDLKKGGSLTPLSNEPNSNKENTQTQPLNNLALLPPIQ